MRSVKTALAAGLAITAVAVGVVLSQSPLTVLATNSASTGEQLGFTTRNTSACQAGERLPLGTVAIRLSLGAFTGPTVKVTAISGTRVVTVGERGSGWDGKTVTIPVKAVSKAISDATICFAIPVAGEGVTVFGAHTGQKAAARTHDGEALRGRFGIAYLGEGRSSWLTLIPSVARHMGRGRAWSSTWIVLLVATLMLTATILTSRLTVRELDE